MSSLKNRHGLSLVEVLIASTMAVIFITSTALFMQKAIRWMNMSQTKNDMVTNARVSTETIARFMQQGLASTVVICACGSSPCSANCAAQQNGSTPPNSRIQFDLAGALTGQATTYAIYWDAQQVNLQITAPVPNEPKVLAKEVGSIFFTGDSTDPSLVYITLRLSHPGNSPQQTQSFTLPNQVVRMQLQ